MDKNLDYRDVANASDFRNLAEFPAKRRRHGRSRVEKIDIATAAAAVAWGHLLLNVSIFASPARSPRLHLENALGSCFAHKHRQLLITETAAGPECVFEMDGPVIRFLLSERRSDRHLGHHGDDRLCMIRAYFRNHAIDGRLT